MRPIAQGRPWRHGHRPMTCLQWWPDWRVFSGHGVHLTAACSRFVFWRVLCPQTAGFNPIGARCLDIQRQLCLNQHFLSLNTSTIQQFPSLFFLIYQIIQATSGIKKGMLPRKKFRIGKCREWSCNTSNRSLNEFPYHANRKGKKRLKAEGNLTLPYT